MATCSIPLKAVIEAINPTPYTINVGDSFPVRGLFSTNGGGASCPQIMNFAYTRNGGFPTSWVPGGVDPVTEGVWYTASTPFVPTKPGKYELYVTLGWRDDSGGPAIHTLEGDTIEVQVQAAAPPWKIERTAP